MLETASAKRIDNAGKKTRAHGMAHPVTGVKDPDFALEV